MTKPTTNDKARPRALITGASAGIGVEFARQLAKRGYDLVLAARRKERMDELAGELSDATVEVVAVDLVTDEGVGELETMLRSGSIDLLVNNAGYGTFGEFAKLPLDRELAQLDLNVRALMRLSHAAAVPMVERKRGAIINVASAAAFQAIPYNATYAATKAYVLSFSEGLHEEAKGYGVNVTCLCPGATRTEFQEVAGLDDDGIPGFWWMSAEAVVKNALRAAKSGSAITTPGLLNKLTANLPRFTPRFAVRKISGAMFKRAATKE